MTKRSYEIEHILMTADAVGGNWAQTLELVRGLARHGVRTTLATMGPALSSAQREAALAIPKLELYTSEYRLEWMTEPWEDVDAAGSWLLALADRVRPDVIHLHTYAHAALPWPAPTLVVGQGDLVSRWHATNGAPAPAEYSEYVRRVQRGLRSAGLVVTPTAAMMADLEANYGPFPTGRVIYNGRTCPELAPAKKRHLVLASGSFSDEAKNLAALQRIATRTEWPIYLAGDLGNDRQPRTHGINFLGRLCSSALGAWYSRAGVFALPAKYESSGATVQEAALCGCALILGDIPSLRELWEDAALFVRPEDEDSLYRAVQRLEQDQGLREQLAARAQERAREYNGTTMVCSYLFAYQDLKQGVELDLDIYLHPGVSLR